MHDTSRRRHPAGRSRAAGLPATVLDRGRLDGVDLRDDLAGQGFDVAHVPGVRHAEHDVLDADPGKRPELIDDFGRRLAAQIYAREVRPFDLLERPPDLLAALLQYAELVLQLLGAAEDVAGVGVLRHQPQRLALAAAADEDAGMWFAQRVGRVEQTRGLVMLALEGGLRAVVALPHLVADLQAFLEHLEALTEGRHREAEPVALFLVPGGSDAEISAAAAQHVEGRRGLCPE